MIELRNRKVPQAVDYLLDFYFYYSCVVSFNSDWYLLPLMPISSNIAKGMTEYSFALKQLLNLDHAFNIVGPIKINLHSMGYNKIKDAAAKKLLSDFMSYPMLGNEHPVIWK